MELKIGDLYFLFGFFRFKKRKRPSATMGANRPQGYKIVGDNIKVIYE